MLFRLLFNELYISSVKNPRIVAIKKSAANSLARRFLKLIYQLLFLYFFIK